MTGYYISLGYNQGNDLEYKWKKVQNIAENITKEQIKREYLKYEKKTIDDDEVTLDQYINKYFQCHIDLTLKINDDDIVQLASGGGKSRLIKQGLRRAFCRLILKKAHKEKIEININVV